MQSSGGIVTAESARELSLQTLLSGPGRRHDGRRRAGPHARAPEPDLRRHGRHQLRRRAGRRRASPTSSSETTLEGFPLLMPVVNIHTIGAGGGSLAYAEAGGLRVGPESAGRRPRARVLRPRRHAADRDRREPRPRPRRRRRTSPAARMTLDVEAARARRRRRSATSSASATAELAEGICDVVNAKMAQAIRTLTVEKGIEPRDFALVAFGGAGPMHAVFLARELGIREVHRAALPRRVLGLGDARDARSARTPAAPTTRRSRELDRAQLGRAARRARGGGLRRRSTDEGITRDTGRVEHALDLRYVGPGVHADRSRSTSAGEPLRGRLRRALSGPLPRRRTTPASATPTPARRSRSSSSARRRSATSGAPSRRRHGRRRGAELPVLDRAASSSTATAQRRAMVQRDDLAARRRRRRARPSISEHDGDDGRAAGRRAAVVDRYGTLVMRDRRGGLMATVGIDPITTEIIRSAFNAAADEMNATLIRSAYTPIIYEMKDCSVALLDADHRVLGQSAGPADLPRQPRDLHAADRGDVRARGVAARRRLDHERLLPHRHAPQRHDGLRADLLTTASSSASPPAARTGSTSAPRTRAARWTRPRSTRRGSALRPLRVVEGGEPSAATSSTCSARNRRFSYPAIGDLGAQIACVRTGQTRLRAIIDRLRASATVARRARRDLRADRAARARRRRGDPRRRSTPPRAASTTTASSRRAVLGPCPRRRRAATR